MMVERLRLVDDAPLAIHTVYLNHALCPQLRQEDLAGASLASVLREVCGLQPARADERVYAALANQREIDMLQLSYPASVLRKVRRTYLSDGSMIEYSLASYCGERYRMRLDLEAL
jgi:GntR family transcriptional regulator